MNSVFMKHLMCVMLLFYASTAWSQQSRAVKGKVIGQDGKALAGMTITEKDGKATAVTNSNGEFNLTVGDGATLIIKGVGYQVREVQAAGGKLLQITLESDVNTIEDVVVVGFGTQSKAKVIGAVSTVKMDQLLADRPVSTTATLLQGVVPGLQVTIPSGRPGEGASLNIRGGTGFGTALNSAISTGAPLILLDNMVYDGPLNLIDPNDIESVTVLKDAGSAAIYGSRSAYGVVLITTKTGKKNQKTQFNYTNNYVFAAPTNLPQKASPERTLQALIDGGLKNYSVGQGQDLARWIALIEDYKANPAKYPGGYVMENNVYYNLKGNNSIEDLLGNRSTQFMNNLSVDGGSEKTTYRIGLGSTNENGIMVPEAKVDNFKRYNLRTNISSDVLDWLNLQVDANYTYANTKRPGYSDPFTYAVRMPSFIAEDTIPGYPGQLATGRNLVMNSYPSTYRYDQLRVNGRFTVTPFQGMSIVGEMGYDNYHALTSSYNKLMYLRDPYGWANQPIGNDQVSKNTELKDYITTNLFATYTKNMQKHHLKGMVGFNQEYKNYEQEVLSKIGPIDPERPAISTSTGDVNGRDAYSQFATQGFFGRLNYDYADKYILELNGRYDGSSRFPKGHRWTFAPSATLGWRLGEENFMTFAKPLVTEFKLRASYGAVANQNIGEYQYLALMDPYNPSWISTATNNRVVTLTTPGLISPDYTWETVTTANFGWTLAFLNNRLSFNGDIYRRNTEGILSTDNTPIPAVLGTSAPLINSASLKTRGFELDLSWQDRVGKVGYNIAANLYDFNSEVTKVNNPNKLLSQLYEGQKLGEIWGYVTDRLYTVDDFEKGTLDANLMNGKLKAGIPRLANQSPNPGDIMYTDFDQEGDGNGIINQGKNTLENPGDRRIIGNSSLRYQFGVRGGVSYQNFDFSFVISGVLKNQQMRSNYLFFPNNWQMYGALYENQLDYWTPENQDAYFGRIYTTTPNGVQQTYNEVQQSRFVLNGAYMRVRNVALRYTLPDALLSKKVIRNLSVSVSVENPFIVHKMPNGMYPDINNLGGGLGYPLMRKTSLGLSLGL